MIAVLISIQPKWCELIASGKKTVEVRKTKPKLETPFKVYIYCTEKDYDKIFAIDKFMHKVFLDGKGKQKIIGEFVCDKIYDITPHFDKTDFCNQYLCGWKWGEGTVCLSFTEMNDYLKGTQGYGWHISDLVIYDKPKKLSEFNHCGVNYHFNPPITRPPQSWCYVEERKRK